MAEFKPKVLQLKTVRLEVEVEDQARRGAESAEGEEEGAEEEMAEEEEEEEEEEEVVEMPTDPTFGLTDMQLSTLQSQDGLRGTFENNMTANIIMGEKDQTVRLREMENKSKVKAKYSTRRRGRYAVARKIWGGVCALIEKFDFFGTRPNLIAEPYGASLVGICGTFLILLLTVLTVALLLRTASTPQLMIDNNYQEDPNFEYRLLTGRDLKFALCISQLSSVTGAARTANLRFFTESKEGGRKYFMPTQLTSSDYGLFEVDPSTFPISLSYCFTMPPEVEVAMARSNGNYGYFGFRLEPYCSSTASYCATYASQINDNFLSFINGTLVYLFLPENRYDVNASRLVSGLVLTHLNINFRYLHNTSGLEETLFIDEVRVLDDTQNWFLRRQPTVRAQGVAANTNTLYPLARNVPGSPYLEVRMQPSLNQVNYLQTTPKADFILGVIGGVFVLWYALLHWLGKVYNGFRVRARLAEMVYYEESINESPLNKLLAIAPLPACLLPPCHHIRSDVVRMRQVDKKIQNDLNYLWLIKHVDNLYLLSSSLFQGLPAKNLSLVFLKDKVDENEEVRPPASQPEELTSEVDFIGYDDFQRENPKLLEKGRNQVLNESLVPEPSLEKINPLEASDFEKFRPSAKFVAEQNGPDEQLGDNFIHGLPKQSRFNWFDSFEYPASLTFQGRREVTSCCGGCCCLLLLMFILLVGAFEVLVYLDKDDSRVGMSTALMQPLQQGGNGTFNSRVYLTSGRNFKLAVTFSSAYEDYPHDVANWTSSSVGISVFQEVFTRQAGSVSTQTLQVPLTPCAPDYLLSWLSPISNPAYYTNTQFGYCLPEGITLEIDGLPEDPVAKRFTLSIFNKAGTSLGNQEVKAFMQEYLPKFHVSNPQLDPARREFDYHMASFTMDAFNVSYPVSQNISLEKVAVLYDDQLALEGDAYQDLAYGFSSFQQFETTFYDSTAASMSYNLSFANSYLVKYYTFQNQKFASTFGIIGGLIALFIFGIGACARSFNAYRMRYLVARELYTFDLLRKKQARNAARGRNHKSREEIGFLSDLNNLHEGRLLLAYLLSFPAALLSDYNFEHNLRRVTLLQQRVEKDLDLFEFYKKLHLMRDTLNQQHPEAPQLASLHCKHLYNPEADSTSLTNQPKILAFAKKHNWSAFEQFAIFEAAQAGVNLKTVFDNAFLERELNLYNTDRTSVHLSQFGGTQGSVISAG
jgi:hypothetical protein